jgi:hypothetical protein
MLHKPGRSGTVEIDGSKYDWELLSDPQLSSSDGAKGMTVALRQHDMPREAVLEFPAPKRLLRGLPKGRLHINDAIAARGVRAALSAGWDPTSRGKPTIFMVDANGD